MNIVGLIYLYKTEFDKVCLILYWLLSSSPMYTSVNCRLSTYTDYRPLVYVLLYGGIQALYGNAWQKLLQKDGGTELD